MRGFWFTVLFLFVVGLALCPPAFSCSLEVKVRVTNWPPGYWKENGQWTGMNIDFFTAL